VRACHGRAIETRGALADQSRLRPVTAKVPGRRRASGGARPPTDRSNGRDDRHQVGASITEICRSARRVDTSANPRLTRSGGSRWPVLRLDGDPCGRAGDAIAGDGVEIGCGHGSTQPPWSVMSRGRIGRIRSNCGAVSFVRKEGQTLPRSPACGPRRSRSTRASGVTLIGDEPAPSGANAPFGASSLHYRSRGSSS
jgi:hypothetical protein